MKKIFSILTIVSVTLFLQSCRGSEELAYDGNSQLLFSAPQSTATATIASGAGTATYNVPFGVLKQVDSDSDVTLVVDPANSTAVQGVDYNIPNATVTLKAGTATGVIPITLLEGGATLAGKKVAFKLKSNSLTLAKFNQSFVLTLSLTCPFVNTKFTGNYSVVTDTWADYSVGDKVPVTPGATASQVYVRATNNPYLVNPSTSYMILTVAADGTFTLASNPGSFDYGAGGGGILSPIGSGTVDRCSGDINISTLKFGNNAGNKFVLKHP